MVNNVTIECPSTIASHEDGECVLYVQEGSYVEIDIVENGVVLQSALSIAGDLYLYTIPLGTVI